MNEIQWQVKKSEWKTPRYGMRREGRWTPTRAKAQDTRASPYTAYSLETHPVEGSALDDGDLTTYVLVPGHQLHQPCHVLGQHLVDGLEQLRFDGVERGEVRK